MNDALKMPSPTPGHTPRQSRRRLRFWCVLGAVAAILLISLASGALWVAHRAEPEARRLVIKQLSERLHCRVELDQLHVSALRGWGGLQVAGYGLRIESIDGSGHLASSGVPMLTVGSFAFRTSFRTLLYDEPGAIDVYVQNVIVTLPPPDAGSAAKASQPAKALPPSAIPGILLLHRVVVTGATIVFEPASQDGAGAMEYHLREVMLDDLGERKAFNFSAALLEPAPLNEVQTTGHLGPWLPASPRDTPLDGSFSLEHGDLGSVAGLAGTLTSKGSFKGTLGQVDVETHAEIPNFALATSAQPVAMHVVSHLVMDNTTGNVGFQGMTAEFLHTRIVTSGTVNRTAAGYVLEEDKDIHGRNEDLLALLSKTKVPVLNGELEFHGHMTVPAGRESVMTAAHLTGAATIRGITWNDRELQRAVDAVSQRAQGRAEVAKGNPAKVPVAPSSMTTQVAIDKGTMNLTRLVLTMPGASIVMQGSYPLTGTQIEMHGVARTAARASQLTTGWKSLLLKPVDPLFRKHGAGAEIPVKLSGDLSHPSFGTDFKNRGEDKRLTEKVATTQRK